MSEKSASEPGATLLQDVLDLFGRRKSRHLCQRMYAKPRFEGDPAGGETFWQDFLREPGLYYIFHDEPALITGALEQIRQYLRGRTALIDLGPGSEDAVERKTVPVGAACDALALYMPIDLSPGFARKACAIIEEHWPRVRTQPVVADFFDPAMSLPRDDAPVVLFFGSTFFNVPQYEPMPTQERMRLFLERMRRDFKGGVLLVVHDCNRDVGQMLAMYRHPTFARAQQSIIHRIAGELPVRGFDPGVFDCAVHWDEDEQAVIFTAQLTDDASFTIGPERFAFKKAEAFELGISCKFAPEKFRQIAERAGLTPHVSFTGSKGRLALHVLGL